MTVLLLASLVVAAGRMRRRIVVIYVAPAAWAQVDRVWRMGQLRHERGGGMIELAEVIGELRRELQQAMNAGEDEPLRFELGPVELEATIAVEKGGSGGAKVRFWVIELGGDVKASQSSTQRIKLAFQPRLAATGKTPLISGEETLGER
jgi:hypothetical protein